MSRCCRKSSRLRAANSAETPLHNGYSAVRSPCGEGAFCATEAASHPRIWLHVMNILLLGSGGREHALAWKIAASPLLTKLWCAPGNAGIAREAECVALDIADHPAVIEFCKKQRCRSCRGRPGDAARGRDRRRSRERRHQGVWAEQGRRRSSKAPRDSPRRSAPNSTFRPAPMAASRRLTMRWPMSARRARRSWSRPTAWPPARASSSRRRLMKPRRPSP